MMTHSNSNPVAAVNNSLETAAAATTGQAAKKGGVFRYGVVLPLAGCVTLGLMLTMAGLVAAEFTPQDKTETAMFEINPVVEDLPDAVRTLEVDPLREVEVPPPPPTIATVKTAAVELPIVEVVGKRIEFDMTDLDFGDGFDSIPIEQDETPLVRSPPVFPNRFLQGDYSGYCRVTFDVSPEGQPFNVSAQLCTNDQLKAPTLKSVQRWKYAPKIQNGRPVSRSGLETTIRFDLNDDRGQRLPLPTGF
jgi:protein TonB